MDIDLSESDVNYLKAIGFPTFDEFNKNPGRWKLNAEQVLIDMQGGSKLLAIEQYNYEICGYKVKTLEKVQQIALDHGWDIRFLELKPDLEKGSAGKLIMNVKVEYKGWLAKGNETQGSEEESVTEDAT